MHVRILQGTCTLASCSVYTYLCPQLPYLFERRVSCGCGEPTQACCVWSLTIRKTRFYFACSSFSGCSLVPMLTIALCDAFVERSVQADMKRAKFFQPEGDHLTLLTVYESWKANKFSNPWCHENFLQARSLRRAQDVRKQLITIMDRYRCAFMPFVSPHTCFELMRRIQK